MDSTAITLCMDNDLPIVVFDLLGQGNIRSILDGERIGTLVPDSGVGRRPTRMTDDDDRSTGPRRRRRQDGQGGRTTPAHEFASVRTGRARSALVEKLPVEYYGSEVPLQQLAGFSVPEARHAGDLAVRQGLDGRHREGDPQLRPRAQPEQRRQRHPPGVPAAHRGAPQGARAAGARTWPRRAGSRCATSAGAARQDLEGLEKDGDLRGRARRGPRRSSTSSPTRTRPRSTRRLADKEQELLED